MNKKKKKEKLDEIEEKLKEEREKKGSKKGTTKKERKEEKKKEKENQKKEKELLEEEKKVRKKTKKVRVGHFRSAWHHLRRSPFQSLAAILVMWLNFVTATALVILVLGFNSLLTYFESRPEVTAFLSDEATQIQVDDLKREINSLEGVKEVRFLSKDDALKIYQEQNKDNPLLLEMVNADILPASLEIAAVGPSYLTAVAERLEDKVGVVEEVVFQKDVVEKLSFWVKNIRNGGIGLVGFLSLVSLIVIMIIIGMKVTTHRDEIRALRSLGASNWYIQAPFLLEGIIHGLVGSFFAQLIVGGALYYYRGQINSFFTPISVLPNNSQLILTISLIELAAGAFWGLIAAWMATRRYLKR